MQWKRVCQAMIGKLGSGLLIENLRMQFEITKTLEAAPNTASIHIFNLHPNNESRIKHEFDEVLINAGYADSMRMLFRGTIKHAFRYRDKNDWITSIEAADGDLDYRTATMNQTLAAGTTTGQLIDRIIGTFTGTTKGYIDVPNKSRIRGRVISGNTRDVLHDVAREAGANWSIQDGQLTIVRADAVLPYEAVVINSDSGMLEAPEINDKGIAVKCLLNPQIKVNGAVHLDNNNIRLKAQKLKSLSDKKQDSGEPVRLDPDGIYKVIKVTHKGDTRGPDWYTQVECVGLSEPIPATRTSSGL
jgi:hypothetical protein